MKRIYYDECRILRAQMKSYFHFYTLEFMCAAHFTADRVEINKLPFMRIADAHAATVSETHSHRTNTRT